MSQKTKKLVIDCSVTLAWYLEDEKTNFTEAVLNRLSEFEVLVPPLWRIEFTNAMLMACKRRRISEEWLEKSLNHANQLPFRFEENANPMFSLAKVAIQYKLTAYDATYLALAKNEKCVLVSLDKALISAAKEANIKLINWDEL
ncbi:MAG: type II toxin-antitoxin system VapC family toxin [Gammaproteobacteria bacterium]|nr:type II toxin-antitoxin system VapC family toxin [Gammaproteobacteria bacterium]